MTVQSKVDRLEQLYGTLWRLRIQHGIDKHDGHVFEEAKDLLESGFQDFYAVSVVVGIENDEIRVAVVHDLGQYNPILDEHGDLTDWFLASENDLQSLLQDGVQVTVCSNCFDGQELKAVLE